MQHTQSPSVSTFENNKNFIKHLRWLLYIFLAITLLLSGAYKAQAKEKASNISQAKQKARQFLKQDSALDEARAIMQQRWDSLYREKQERLAAFQAQEEKRISDAERRLQNEWRSSAGSRALDSISGTKAYSGPYIPGMHSLMLQAMHCTSFLQSLKEKLQRN